MVGVAITIVAWSLIAWLKERSIYVFLIIAGLFVMYEPDMAMYGCALIIVAILAFAISSRKQSDPDDEG